MSRHNQSGKDQPRPRPETPPAQEPARTAIARDIVRVHPPASGKSEKTAAAAARGAKHSSQLVAASKRSLEDRRKEIVRIVRRLEAIVINHVEGARRIHHPLTLEQVIAVIDALRAEAEGGSRPVAFSDGEVAFYLMDGLYEELLGEPSNIFSLQEMPDGAVRIEPLQRDLWLECLASMRLRMEHLGLSKESAS